MPNEVTMTVIYKNRLTSIRGLLGLEPTGNSKVSMPKYREIIKIRITKKSEMQNVNCSR